jgi:hypothetical protein
VAWKPCTMIGGSGFWAWNRIIMQSECAWLGLLCACSGFWAHSRDCAPSAPGWDFCPNYSVCSSHSPSKGLWVRGLDPYYLQ